MKYKYKTIKCDKCGKFISYQDIIDKKASHIVITSDSYYTFEEWESLCKNCCKKELTK